ncbi:hypothetical protein [Solitalea longa]|nr:hypothetical protein [Solitalea longa]
MERKIIRFKDKNVDYEASMLNVTMKTNALLSTMLDVLIDIHCEGKSDDYRLSYVKEIVENLTDNNERESRELIES